uniref:Transmembrane protein 31 n=1 Tax=Moschus moschiferus TaxID=68415 RepID=A0A8C6CJ80_MOSMO
TNKNERKQLMPNKSDAPSGDQGEEMKEPEHRTPAGQRTQRAGTRPSRCRLLSHRTPATSINGKVNLPRVLSWPLQWITSLHQLPAILQLYPEFLLVFKEAFIDMSHYPKDYVKKIRLPIMLHPSALFTLHFHLLFLPILLFLPFFFLFELLLLLLIILFILILF